MSIAKECGLQLITSLFSTLDSSEPALLELCSPLYSSDSVPVRIMASKYLHVIFALLRKFSHN
jgi:hypothetical protein